VLGDRANHVAIPEISYSIDSDLAEMLEGGIGPEGRAVRHATFDDSGGKQDGAFIYAGYISPERYWERFNRAWDDALAYYHLPYLHTAEFLQTIPIIGHAPRTDDDAYVILKPFIDVIQQHLVWGEGFAVVGVTIADAWSSLAKEERKVVRQPALDSFESAVGLACLFLAPYLSRANPLAIQVDEGGDIAVMAGAYKKLKRFSQYRESIGGICFIDDTKLRSIQAADMLAHLVLRQWRKDKLAQSLEPRLLRLITDNPDSEKKHILIHDKDTLRVLAQKRIERREK
jgi:hypothetical protein